MLFLAIIFLAFYITKPFLPSLITAAIIAYLSYPLFQKTTGYVRSRKLASFIVSLIIVLLITVPFIVVLSLVSREAVGVYQALNYRNGIISGDSQHTLGANFMKIVCKDENGFSCRSLKALVALLPNNDLDYFLKSTIRIITGFILNNVSDFLVSIPSILLSLFVMIFAVYYLFLDGEILAKRIRNILPLKGPHKQNVINKFHNITTAVFYGNIAVAVVQGALGAIGFLIFGVKSAVLWGCVMMFFALIPYFGTAIVWLPAALNLIFLGYLQDNTSQITKGVLLIIYGIVVVSTIDNILKPKLISHKANVHPILVLVGVLGGLNLFGFFGLVLGPVMLALLMTFVEIYEEEKAEIEKYF